MNCIRINNLSDRSNMPAFAKAVKFILKEGRDGIFRPNEKQREALSAFYRKVALGLYGVTAYFLWRDGFEKPFFTTIVLIIASASLIGSIKMLANPKKTADGGDA